MSGHQLSFPLKSRRRRRRIARNNGEPFFPIDSYEGYRDWRWHHNQKQDQKPTGGNFFDRFKRMFKGKA